MILFTVKDALVKVQTQQRLIDLYRATVLPQAEQSLQATIAAYQTQQTDFLSLLDSYRMLQMFKLEYYEATAMYEMNFAMLERAVGKKLE
jgi:outer membrane protein TolC